MGETRTRLGFIGLGAMGGPMAANLAVAGYEVAGFDLDAERLGAAGERGVEKASSGADAASGAEVVLISVRSSAALEKLAEGELLDGAREGQVYIDLGTTTAPATRRLARAFAERGAHWLDVPVSGGSGGAAEGSLRMFAGGEEAVYARVRPILEVLGDPRRIVYCGPSGTGQVAKAVNQLGMGLSKAYAAEAISLAARAGADLDAVRQGVGGDDGWRRQIRDMIDAVRDRPDAPQDIKYAELAYFIAEADIHGVPMPMTRALEAFCAASKDWATDNMGRKTPVLWQEYLKRDV